MEWVQVKIPSVTHKEIIDIISQQPELGYTGPNEFIRDALRDKIIAVQQNPKEETS